MLDRSPQIMKYTFLTWIFFFHGIVHSQVSSGFFEQNQPKFEFGVGLLGANIPNYPGASNSRMRWIPIPWLIYRGDTLRSDDEGMRIRFNSSKYYEVGLSAGFNFPVKSSDNPSRVGMPDLDGIIGLGPRIMFRLLKDKNGEQLNISIGGRATASTNFSNRWHHVGVVFEPAADYWKNFGKESNTTLILRGSVSYGDKGYEEYFYQVDSLYQTPQRPTYNAKPGLSQISLALAASQVLNPDLQIFGGLFYSNFSLSANIDSPLLETKETTAIGLGFIYMTFKSN